MKPRLGHQVAILGGGFMGLGAALRLAQAGLPVTLYESSPAPGGVSASFSLGGMTVDRFYHTILPGDTVLLSLIEEMGLTDRVHWRATRTGFFRGNKLYSVSNILEFLRFDVLSPLERLRLGWTLFRAQRSVSCESIRGLTCEEWLSREGGRAAYDKLWRPLLKGKLGAAAPRVSASFIWATMNRLQDAKRGDGVRQGDRMGFLAGGYGVLLDRMVKKLETLGVRIRTGAAVTGVAPEGDGWRVRTEASDESYSTLLAALPLPALNRLLDGGPETRPSAAPDLSKVEYLGVIVEVLLLRRPLGPFYILNLGEDDFSVTGIIETTNLAPVDYFEGRSLVYLPRYVLQDDPGWSMQDTEVRAAFRRDLARVFPAFDEDQVMASSVQRARLVQPVHTVDYPERTPPTRYAPGFWIASSAQVYPWPLANDRILRQAEQVVGEILKERGVE